jgi:hypothetical protein
MARAKFTANAEWLLERWEYPEEPIAHDNEDPRAHKGPKPKELKKLSILNFRPP